MRDSKHLFLILTITLMIHAALSSPEAIDSILTRLDSKRISSSAQESATKGVLRRLLPTDLSSFEFKIVSKDACGGGSCFSISNSNLSSQKVAEIIIEGTTAIEIVPGLHWYLKYWCGAHVSWDKTGGIQIASVPMPGSLPHVKDGGVMIQ